MSSSSHIARRRQWSPSPAIIRVLRGASQLAEKTPTLFCSGTSIVPGEEQLRGKEREKDYVGGNEIKGVSAERLSFPRYFLSQLVKI